MSERARTDHEVRRAPARVHRGHGTRRKARAVSYAASVGQRRCVNARASRVDDMKSDGALTLTRARAGTEASRGHTRTECDLPAWPEGTVVAAPGGRGRARRARADVHGQHRTRAGVRCAHA
jgi:hypothetical protein